MYLFNTAGKKTPPFSFPFHPAFIRPWSTLSILLAPLYIALFFTAMESQLEAIATFIGFHSVYYLIVTVFVCTPKMTKFIIQTRLDMNNFFLNWELNE